jgi:hypothetical protein
MHDSCICLPHHLATHQRTPAENVSAAISPTQHTESVILEAHAVVVICFRGCADVLPP